jgi:predicted AlkP superfamily phosphohydrolase/phosphomutase
LSSAGKVLILALDSVNREALSPHLDAGRMPALKRLISGGASGILHSTIPAHTAAAWTTLSTGKHPGIHGVMNFRRFDPRTQQTRLNTTLDVPHKTIWQLLDERGMNVGVVGQPQSYPPRELKKGFAVSGFETPSTDCAFAWPAALREEVLSRVPGFCFKSELGRLCGRDGFVERRKRAGARAQSVPGLVEALGCAFSLLSGDRSSLSQSLALV